MNIHAPPIRHRKRKEQSTNADYEQSVAKNALNKPFSNDAN
jgi:hypothetical protein